MSAIQPGATLGILGGGQLGRMTAQAARAMGYRVHVLDPDPDHAARHVVEHSVTAAFDDAEAAARLARGCDVVTLEIEKIATEALHAASQHSPVRPGAEVLHVIQDRGRQKDFLARNGFPVSPYDTVSTAAQATAAATRLGPGFLKRCSGGYDGRGQALVARADEAAAAWASLGEAPCVLERRVDLAAELSVMVARGPDGRAVAYPPALNHHEQRILAWSVLPGPIAPAIAVEARKVALALAEALGVVGLLCVEFFLDTGGKLIVNELAPRPHNSYHASTAACETGQFEQLVRAVTGLPLGGTDIVKPAAILNILGDLWSNGPPDWSRALAVPGTHLFLYGKAPRPARKVGHLLAVGDTPQQAVARVLEAKAALG